MFRNAGETMFPPRAPFFLFAGWQRSSWFAAWLVPQRSCSAEAPAKPAPPPLVGRQRGLVGARKHLPDSLPVCGTIYDDLIGYASKVY